MTTDEKIDNLDARVARMEKTLFQVKMLFIGMGIGILLTGIVFGIIGLKELEAILKNIK